MPEVPWSNTNAPTIAVSEKCADQIKIEYGMPTEVPGVCNA